MAAAEQNMATAIFDITHLCLHLFDNISEKCSEAILTQSFVLGGDSTRVNHHKSSSCDFLGLRNSFLFWIDYTGALSLMSSSLDVRLQGLVDISAMVIELLEMILRNLRRSRFQHQPDTSQATKAVDTRTANKHLSVDHEPESPSIDPADPITSDSSARRSFLSTWEDVFQAVASALDRLHFIGVAIRKASAKKLDHTVTTLLTEEDMVFRRDIASLVRYRFPAARKGLCQQLGDSIAVRRRMLLQNKRHAKKLAIRRVPENLAPATQNKHMNPEPNTPKNRLKDRIARPPQTLLASAITKASRPDPQAPVLRQLHHPKPRALTTVITTISTAQDDSFGYPPLPTASEGEARIQCPFCLIPLERKDSEEKSHDIWKHHVDEHLKPYGCMFPECTESMVFFVRRHEWKSHLESVHSKDWLRKVHTITWYCDIDHDPPETFETELQWRNHMQDLGAHPKRKLAAPTRAQLEALSPRKQQVALRDKFVCPLCEQIPEKIQVLVNNGKGDPIDMYNFVVDHVANHLKSLSLMAVPSLQNATQETSGPYGESVMMMKDSFKRLMNENSIPQPPSGGEQLDTASLPPEQWSTMSRDNIASFAASALLDDQYADYLPPVEPPEPTQNEWIECWELWKKNNNYSSSHSLEKDPILMHIRQLKTASLYGVDINHRNAFNQTQLSLAAKAGDVTTTQSLLDKGADIEAADQDGQTPLSQAAYEGHIEIVQLLLDKGAVIEAADKYGQTPLSRAAYKGHIEIVQLLLDKGAVIEAANKYGQTPLSQAAYEGHIEIVQLLLDKGADIEAADQDGQTPLSQAAYEGHIEIVQLLLDKGVVIEAADNYGQTPLSQAAYEGYIEIVQLLLDKGAVIEAADQDGQTPLSRAAVRGHDAVVQLLLNHGAEVETTDREHGRSPLSLAAENGHEETVKLLLEHGASLEPTDTQGRTAISWAVENKHEGVLQLLRSHKAKITSKP